MTDKQCPICLFNYPEQLRQPIHYGDGKGNNTQSDPICGTCAEFVWGRQMLPGTAARKLAVNAQAHRLSTSQLMTLERESDARRRAAKFFDTLGIEI